MKNYRGIIFDLDGTLLDTAADLGNSANLVLSEYGHPPYDEATIKTFVGRGMMNLMHRCFPADTPEELFPTLLDRLIYHYQIHMMDETRPYDGIHRLLRILRDAGIPMAINSNKRHAFTVQLARTMFPDIPFVDIVGEGGDFPRKPKPDGALYLAQRMDLPAEEILYIGDSGTDIDTGKNAGMDTIGCIWGFRGEPELTRHNATYLVHSAEEILPFFLSH